MVPSYYTVPLMHALICIPSIHGEQLAQKWQSALTRSYVHGACSGQQQEQHASLLGRSLYRPPGSLANGSIAEEEGVSRSPSLGPPSRNSSTLSGRSSLASNPLLRSPTDFSTKISPLQRPSHARTLVVSAPCRVNPSPEHCGRF